MRILESLRRPWPLLVSLFCLLPLSFLRAQTSRGLSFRKIQDLSNLPPANILRLADVDGDGDLDLYLGTHTRTWDLLFLNDGKGRFKKSNPARLQSLVDITYQVQFKDVDGDGDLDLFKGTDRGIRILFNDGKGLFREKKKTFPPLKEYHSWCALGDLDGDKDPDLLFSTWTKERVGRLHVTRLQCRLNDGKGKFSDPILLDRTIGFTCLPVLLDMNKDGRTDVLEIPLGVDTHFKKEPPLLVLLNKGDMKFQRCRLQGIPGGDRYYSGYYFGYWGNGFGNSDLPLGDVDGDGYPDLLLGYPLLENISVFPHRFHLFRNLDGKTFEEDKGVQEVLARFFRKSGIGRKWWPFLFLFHDLDGDGDLDMAPFYSSRQENSLAWKACFLQNQGKGSFRVLPLEVDFPDLRFMTGYFVAGDLNGDGAPDLVLATAKFPKYGSKPLPKGGSLQVYLQERKPAPTTGKTPITPGGKGSGKKKRKR